MESVLGTLAGKLGDPGQIGCHLWSVLSANLRVQAGRPLTLICSGRGPQARLFAGGSREHRPRVGLPQREEFPEKPRGSLSEGLDWGPEPRTAWFQRSRETLANSGCSMK